MAHTQGREQTTRGLNHSQHVHIDRTMTVFTAPKIIKADGSTHNKHVQESCMKSAAKEGITSGLQALAASTVAVLGACKVFPGFNKKLSVSSKTALIASPFFAAFALFSELELNACARRHRQLLLAEKNASP